MLKKIRFIKVCWIRDMLKRAIFFHVRTLQLSRTLAVQHINQAENPFLKWKDWFFFSLFPDDLHFLAWYAQSASSYCALMTLLLTHQLHFNGIFWQRQGWEYRHSHLPYIPKHNIKEVDMEQRVFGTLTWTRRGVIWRKRSAFPLSPQCSSVITFNQILNKSQPGLLLYWQGTGEDTNMKHYGFIPSSNSIMHIWALWGFFGRTARETQTHFLFLLFYS